MLFDKRKNEKSKKQLDSAMLAINSMLNDIYSNKSSDEYKMKGDITKSPSYKKIEEMIVDLKTLKNYNQKDAADIAKMFNTLHRPVFKTMVKEYIMEHNDKNTLFTATFTVGYRLLVGELTRIFAATEATDKGIVYKPNKVSRQSDATRMIKIYNDNLESILNKYVQDMKKYPEESPVNEAYLSMVIASVFQETADEDPDQSDKSTVEPVKEAEAINDLSDEEWKAKGMISSQHARTMAIKRGIKPYQDPEWKEKLEQTHASGVKPVKEADDTDIDAVDADGDSDTVQEAAAAAVAGAVAGAAPAGKLAVGLGRAAAGLAGVTGTLAWYGTTIGIIATSLGIIYGLFKGVNALFKGFNPISEINYMFMNSYDAKIKKLSAVSSLYDETKRAYEDYMKNPDNMRKKKVENKYLKNMEKYNIQMQNLSAQVEHFNQRAKKESAELVYAIDKKLPGDDLSPKPSGGDAGNTAGNNASDDDFQF